MKPATSKRTEPLRLLRRRGTWSVEYTRLVSVDEHILRPERWRAPATTDLLRSLENCPTDRIDEAVTLMDEADDGSERAFELGDGGWREAPTATPSQRPLGRNELQTMLAETKSQLAVLRGLYDALLSRVVALESTQAQSLRSLPPRTVRRVPSRKSVLDALRHGSTREPADRATREEPGPPASHAPVDLSRAPAAPAAPPEPPRAAQPSPDATQASPGVPALSMPASTDMVSCLQMLVADLTVNPAKAPAPTDLGDFYTAVLSDEAGEPLAALLFNHRAAAELGAGILMASIADRDQQAQGELTSDTLDGLNEVANNLTGLLNRTNPNRLVRLGALEKAPAAPPDWLQNPAKTRAFSLRENGALFLLVR